MNRRHGISLVELLAVLSGCTLVLTMSAVLIARSMRAESETRYFFDLERAALRLSNQLRRDLHRAREAEIDGNEREQGELFRLDLGDRESVAYRRNAERIVRVLTRDANIVSREEYPLSAAMEITVQQQDDPPRLVLSITSSPDFPPNDKAPTATTIRQAPVNLQVEAVVGRDLRRASARAREETAR